MFKERSCFRCSTISPDHSSELLHWKVPCYSCWSYVPHSFMLIFYLSSGPFSHFPEPNKTPFLSVLFVLLKLTSHFALIRFSHFPVTAHVASSQPSALTDFLSADAYFRVMDGSLKVTKNPIWVYLPLPWVRCFAVVFW